MVSSPLSNFNRFTLTDLPDLLADSLAKRTVMSATLSGL